MPSVPRSASPQCLERHESLQYDARLVTPEPLIHVLLTDESWRETRSADDLLVTNTWDFSRQIADGSAVV